MSIWNCYATMERPRNGNAVVISVFETSLHLRFRDPNLADTLEYYESGIEFVFKIKNGSAEACQILMRWFYAATLEQKTYPRLLRMCPVGTGIKSQRRLRKTLLSSLQDFCAKYTPDIQIEDAECTQ